MYGKVYACCLCTLMCVCVYVCLLLGCVLGREYTAHMGAHLVSSLLEDWTSLVPRLPDLFNVHEKEGGTWDLISRDKRWHEVMKEKRSTTVDFESVPYRGSTVHSVHYPEYRRLIIELESQRQIYCTHIYTHTPAIILFLTTRHTHTHTHTLTLLHPPSPPHTYTQVLPIGFQMFPFMCLKVNCQLGVAGVLLPATVVDLTWTVATPPDQPFPMATFTWNEIGFQRGVEWEGGVTEGSISPVEVGEGTGTEATVETKIRAKRSHG